MQIIVNDIDGKATHTVSTGTEVSVRAEYAADHPVQRIIDRAIDCGDAIDTYDWDGGQYTTRVTVSDSTTAKISFRFATDSESGTIEAVDFAEACEKLNAMLTPEAIDDGAWGWVEDTDGYRYEIGSSN